MTAERCRQWRESLGAHALGQLPDEERPALEAHLEGCAACRSELDSLSAVARALPLADAESFEPAALPPPALADRVVSAIGAERRVRRRRLLRRGLVAGAATAAVAAALVALLALPGADPGEGQRVSFDGLPLGIEISARLLPRDYGTEVHVYVKGAPPGTLCRVFLRGPGGGRLPAGSFRYSRDEDSRATLGSALDLSRAEAIGVRVGRRTFVAPV